MLIFNFHLGKWFMASFPPSKGDCNSVNIEPNTILMRANTCPGTPVSLNGKARIRLAIPMIIILIIIGIIICSGIAGAGRGP